MKPGRETVLSPIHRQLLNPQVMGPPIPNVGPQGGEGAFALHPESGVSQAFKEAPAPAGCSHRNDMGPVPPLLTSVPHRCGTPHPRLALI